MATDNIPQSFFERHRDKIELGAPSGCWLWAAATLGIKYGSVRRCGKTRYAHREAYEAENGADSASGFVIRHKCDTPLCVNPDHLVLGTVADNVRDMMERGRHVAPKGEAHGRAKLSEDDVRAIRATYVFGSHTHGHRALGRRFGVDHTLIGDIIRRERWAHVS